MLNLVLRTLENSPYAWAAQTFDTGLLEAFRGQELFWQLKTLSRSYFDRSHYEDLLRDRQDEVSKCGLPVTLSREFKTGRLAVPREEGLRRKRGETVLALYFHQVFSGECTFLDLQARSFVQDPAAESTDGALVWAPSPLHVFWQAQFRTHLMALYEGFFLQDENLFLQGLTGTGLGQCRAQYERHLSRWLRPDAPFEMDELIEHITEILVASRAQRSWMHPNLLPLCVYTVSLYEHLSTLGTPVDVLAAFRRAIILQ